MMILHLLYTRNIQKFKRNSILYGHIQTCSILIVLEVKEFFHNVIALLICSFMLLF